MRHLPCCLALLLTLSAGAALADSQTYKLSTGYNETAYTTDLNRGTLFEAQVARGNWLYAGSLDSHGLGSFGLGRISSLSDIEANTTRYPVITVFGRPGAGSGIAVDLHQDWYFRGTPTPVPNKHVSMFETQGGVVFQDGHAPKVRVTHRLVTSERQNPARTQGLEWVWEFRQDYPAVYSPTGGRGDMTTLSRRSMRIENWIFFSHEVGPAVMKVNLGATYKTVPDNSAASQGSNPVIDQASLGSQNGFKRVPVLMFRVGFEVRRW